MSNYDPFQIYTKRSRSTHKGQVLRKKIPNYIGYCFTNEELDRAIEGLIARGYRIFKPGQRLSSKVFYSQVYNISSGSLTFDNLNDIKTVQFSTLWANIYNDFSPYLQVDPIRTSNVIFRVDIISINLFNLFQLPNASNSDTEILFYFFDPEAVIDITDSSVRFNSSSSNSSYSLQSLDNANLLAIYNILNAASRRAASTNIIAKLENTGEPYLNTIIRQQSAILTALKNQDYTVFNPSLFSVVFGGENLGPLSISDSMYTVRVHLQYETS